MTNRTNTKYSILKNILCFLAFFVLYGHIDASEKPISKDSLNAPQQKKSDNHVQIYISDPSVIVIAENTITNIPSPQTKEAHLIKSTKKDDNSSKSAFDTKRKKDEKELSSKKIKVRKTKVPPPFFLHQIPSENENLFAGNSSSKAAFQISNFHNPSGKIFAEKVRFLFLFKNSEKNTTFYSDIFYKYLSVSSFTTRPPPVC